jgi:hypothetical protein
MGVTFAESRQDEMVIGKNLNLAAVFKRIFTVGYYARSVFCQSYWQLAGLVCFAKHLADESTAPYSPVALLNFYDEMFDEQQIRNPIEFLVDGLRQDIFAGLRQDTFAWYSTQDVLNLVVKIFTTHDNDDKEEIMYDGGETCREISSLPDDYPNLEIKFLASKSTRNICAHMIDVCDPEERDGYKMLASIFDEEVQCILEKLEKLLQHPATHLGRMQSVIHEELIMCAAKPVKRPQSNNYEDTEFPRASTGEYGTEQ